MARRFHITTLRTGDVALDAVQSRHARDVLRLTAGTEVELFDDAGQAAAGTIVVTEGQVVVRVSAITAAPANRLKLVVASAVPKANRADWMIEKLAEIGVDVFIPLAAARSVVLPEGRGKLDRWDRLSAEAAKQSRRIGVMAIEPLTDVTAVLKSLPADGVAWCLSTEAGSVTISTAVESILASRPTTLTLLIGPEGGWTPDELTAFAKANVQAVRMTASVLRIETAALVAAGIAASLADAPSPTMPPS